MFRRKPKVKGYIGHFGLEAWWCSLTEEQRQGIKANHAGINVDKSEIDEREISKDTTLAPQQFLGSIAGNASKSQYRQLAELVGLKALETHGNATSRHFLYNTLIDVYFKQRADRQDAIDLCIHYCYADIDNLRDFIKEWRDEELRLKMWAERKGQKYTELPIPRIPSLERLTRLYEQRKDYENAIKSARLL